MDDKTRERLLEQAAKRQMLLWALHLGLFFFLFYSGRRLLWLHGVLLVAYLPCALALDRVFWRLKSGEDIRTLRRYWAAGSICMAIWMRYGDGWLGSSDVFPWLLYAMVIPYAPPISANYENWPWNTGTLAGTLCMAFMLLFCLAQWMFYLYLSRRNQKKA